MYLSCNNTESKDADINFEGLSIIRRKGVLILLAAFNVIRHRVELAIVIAGSWLVYDLNRIEHFIGYAVSNNSCM